MNYTKEKLEGLLKATDNEKTKKAIKGILAITEAGEVSEGSLASLAATSLIKLKGEDKVLESYFSAISIRENLNNLGLKSLISTTKKTKAYESNLELKQMIDEYDELSKEHPEYMLVGSFMPGIRQYTWNKYIRSSLSVMENRIEKFMAYKLVAEAIDTLKTDKNPELYDDIVEKLDRVFALPENQVLHYVRTTLSESQDLHPAIPELMKNLRLIERQRDNGGYSDLSKVTYVTDRHQGRVSAQERVTPALFEDKRDVILINRSLFEIKTIGDRKTISEIRNFAASGIPDKFIKLCESFLRFTPDDGKLKIHDGTHQYAVAIKEDDNGDTVAKVEVDDIEQEGELEEILAELNTMGVRQDILELISDIATSAEDITLMDNIVTVNSIDKKIVIDIIKLGSQDCEVFLNIHDMNSQLSELINKEANPDAVANIENDYGVDITPFVDEQDEEGNGGEGDELSDEEKEKQAKKEEIEKELEECKQQLEEVEDNIEKINMLDDETKDDEEIQNLKTQLEEKKGELMESIKDLETELNDGEPVPDDIDTITEKILEDFNEIKKDADGECVREGKLHRISETVSVVPILEFKMEEKEDEEDTNGEGDKIDQPEVIDGVTENENPDEPDFSYDDTPEPEEKKKQLVLSSASLKVRDTAVEECDDTLREKFEGSKYMVSEGGMINLGLKPFECTGEEEYPEEFKEDIANVLNTISPADDEGKPIDDEPEPTPEPTPEPKEDEEEIEEFGRGFKTTDEIANKYGHAYKIEEFQGDLVVVGVPVHEGIIGDESEEFDINVSDIEENQLEKWVEEVSDLFPDNKIIVEGASVKVNEKGGTEPDQKDNKRIDDLVAKGGGDAESERSLKLANQMANSIKDGEKAYRRGAAAKEMGYNKIAKIFFDKAKEFGVEE